MAMYRQRDRTATEHGNVQTPQEDPASRFILWTPTHGNGNPLMAMDTHLWQWTLDIAMSGYPLS